VLDYEKEHGNEFEIDIEMKCDLNSLGNSDDLKKTVDYLAVYKLIEKIFTGKKYENYPLVKSVRVSIRKPNAPLGIIDSVEVINEVTRK
jgi:dihydroneopterin aldolase